jgi:hypothetical protein
MSSSLGSVIFVGLKKVVGGALLFFGAMTGSSGFAVVLAKKKELKLC